MEGTLDFSTPEITQLRKKLAAQRRRYFFARTYTAKKKAQDEERQTRREIKAAMVKARQTITAEQAKSTQAQTGSAGDAYAEQVANWNPYDQNASSPFFDPDWMFGIKDGFDIVIGNPPYVKLETIKKKSNPDADTSALEAEIDQLVYKLYDLTPEEIAVVEGKGGMAKEPAAKRLGGEAKGKKADKESEAVPEVATEEEYEELN